MKVKEFLKKNLLWIIMVPVVFVIDRIPKIIAKKNFAGGRIEYLIKNFAGFTYVENDGAAWNLLGGSRIILSAISIVACILIAIYYFKGKHDTLEKVCLVMMFSGALCNGVDRVLYGKVIDMFYVNIFIIFNAEFPVFNIADLFVTSGAFIFIGKELFKK